VLSGGERKIISIIRSLMANTKLLLLDEPTEGMSPVMVDKTCKLLKELNAEKGLTILWVEPGAKLRKVLEVADKIAMTPPRLEERGFEPLGLGCYPSGWGLWFQASHPGLGVHYAPCTRRRGLTPQPPSPRSLNLITTPGSVPWGFKTVTL
jgi:hypothetical protein